VCTPTVVSKTIGDATDVVPSSLLRDLAQAVIQLGEDALSGSAGLAFRDTHQNVALRLPIAVAVRRLMGGIGVLRDEDPVGKLPPLRRALPLAQAAPLDKQAAKVT